MSNKPIDNLCFSCELSDICVHQHNFTTAMEFDFMDAIYYANDDDPEGAEVQAGITYCLHYKEAHDADASEAD